MMINESSNFIFSLSPSNRIEEHSIKSKDNLTNPVLVEHIDYILSPTIIKRGLSNGPRLHYTDESILIKRTEHVHNVPESFQVLFSELQALCLDIFHFSF